MLMLHRGESLSYVAKTLCAARSSIGRWINWFTLFGIDGLKSLSAGRQKKWPVEVMIRMLNLLVERSPQDFGYLRLRWSTEMLTIEINKLFNSTLHPRTIRRWLPEAGIVWRRAAPTSHIRDPHKEEKLAAISEALEQNCAVHPVFYEDEVDIDLNPKIGADWQKKGKQKRIPTPGKNEKHYLAGTLNAGDYVSGTSKNSALFINMLRKLKRTYRSAKTTTLIVDNYIIHKSKKTLEWLKSNPEFIVIYQPVYSPWVNKIELLWLALHETVTRNHRCKTMWQLLNNVRQFMRAASPIPGNKHGLIKV
ncbi:IS630 family transposase [Yersinia pseudotuberculosis]|nr:Transposase [Yersinia pseudotuberculosis]CNH92619.1 IS630 family transposase [Yersinia pseudotuberculosis]CNI21490.1 IS630 family transposase [Yersinia pseudotuberculosis]CRY71827.1 IS630 family transposase [Yersinia pseudotuberculosis]